MRRARTGPGGRPLAGLRRRLRGRPDTEHEQAIIRIAIVALLLIAFAPLALLLPHPAGFEQGALFATGYLLLSLGYLAWIVADPGISRPRRVLGMITDHTALSLVVLQGDAWVGALYPIYLWITFGNGFRYGIPYLAGAAGYSVLAFAVAAWLNPFWHDNLALTGGLALALIVLPAYVASLIRKLTEAKRVAEAANRAKSRFLATMSHELRTPLNAVIGLSDLLGATKLDRDQADMVGTVGSSARALLALINDILDLAKIESGKSELQHETYDLAGELAASLDMLRAQAERKGLALGLLVDADVPARVRGDVRHLRQILLNLLSNAVKFTREGGVTLQVTGRPEGRGHRLTLRVEDTGIGIGPDQQARIFDAFTQGDEEANRAHGGTGLGLAIARQLAQTLGGDLTLQSTPGRGSRFTLDLPVDAADAGGPATAGAAALGPVQVAAPGRMATGPLEAALAEAGATLASAPSAAGRTDPPGAVVVDLRDARPADGTPMAQLANTELSGTLADLAAGARGCLLLAPPDLSVPDELVRALGTAVRLRQAEPDRRALQAGLDLLAALTARPSENPMLAEQLAPTAGRRHARVLVVEDNPVNRKVTAKILERGGHTPLLAGSGEEALDRLEAEDVDLVLMDVNMPGDSGIDTVKLFRFTQLGAGQLGGGHLPILALTADATVATRDACLEAGMDDFITKPVDAARLLQVLDKHLPPPAPDAADAEAPRAGAGTPDAPVVDPAAVATLQELDPSGEFLAEVVADFVQDTADLLTQLQRAVDAGHRVEARDLLHAVKSSAGNVGAARLRARAMAAADSMRHESGGGRAAVAELRAEAERFRTTVAAELPGGAPAPPARPADAGSAQTEPRESARVIPLHRPSRVH